MKPSEMTDEQLKIRVAELLGWTRIRETEIIEADRVTTHRGFIGLPAHRRDEVVAVEKAGFGDFPAGSEYPCEWEVPDWPHDLNACHEIVRKAFSGDQIKWSRYCDLLLELAGENEGGAFEATARQRCIAFVSVMEAK